MARERENNARLAIAKWVPTMLAHLKVRMWGFLNGGKHTPDKPLSDSINSKSVWNSFSVCVVCQNLTGKCRQGSPSKPDSD